MNRDWLQLLSNVAVIVGLGIVAYELNQSQRLAIVQAQQEWTAMFNDAQLTMVESDYIPAILVKVRENGVKSLSDEERVRMNALTSALVARLDMMHLQYQEGFLSRETYKATFEGVVKRFGPQWKVLGANLEYRRASFREAVESVLDEGPTN